MNLRPLTTVLVLVLTLAVCAVLAGTFELRREKVSARNLIEGAERLDRDKSSSSAFDDFLLKHNSMRSARDCNEVRCTYSATLKNTLLSFFHLAPPSEFYMSVTRSQGHVEEVYLSVKTAMSGRNYAATIRSRASCNPECEGFWSDVVLDPSSGSVVRSVTELGPSANAEDRKLAFRLNVNCIFDLGGCSNPSCNKCSSRGH